MPPENLMIYASGGGSVVLDGDQWVDFSAYRWESGDAYPMMLSWFEFEEILDQMNQWLAAWKAHFQEDEWT